MHANDDNRRDDNRRVSSRVSFANEHRDDHHTRPLKGGAWGSSSNDTHSDDNRQRFSIVLEGIDDMQPVVIRLRQLLKLALRGLRLRCVECRETTEATTTAEQRESST
jgi:hypothetical protein